MRRFCFEVVVLMAAGDYRDGGYCVKGNALSPSLARIELLSTRQNLALLSMYQSGAFQQPMGDNITNLPSFSWMHHACGFNRSNREGGIWGNRCNMRARRVLQA